MVAKPLERANSGQYSSVTNRSELSTEQSMRSSSLEEVNRKDVSTCWSFPSGLVGRESTCNAGDTGDLASIHGWERSPGGGNGNPLWYSCLENPMDREPCGLPVHGGLIVSDTTEHICTQNVLITSFSVKLTLLAFFLLLLEPQSSVLSQYLGLLGMYSVPNKCTYS